jgi:diacylglycerol kinase
MFNLKKFFRSVGFAGKGFATVFRTQQNFRMQFFAALVALSLSWYLQIEVWQWIIIIVFIVLILMLEMVNTAFELLVDMYKPRIHQYAGDIKNIMAGMVFIAVISAVIVGGMIFIPAIFWR